MACKNCKCETTEAEDVDPISLVYVELQKVYVELRKLKDDNGELHERIVAIDRFLGMKHTELDYCGVPMSCMEWAYREDFKLREQYKINCDIKNLKNMGYTVTKTPEDSQKVETGYQPIDEYDQKSEAVADSRHRRK